jgi:hypothetical protein
MRNATIATPGTAKAEAFPADAADAAAACAAFVHAAPHCNPTCGLVSLVRTISSSGITCAGLKKCAPSTRRWARVLAPTRLMSMVDVLVERMASGRQADSRSAHGGGQGCAARARTMSRACSKGMHNKGSRRRANAVHSAWHGMNRDVQPDRQGAHTECHDPGPRMSAWNGACLQKSSA